MILYQCQINFFNRTQEIFLVETNEIQNKYMTAIEIGLNMFTLRLLEQLCVILRTFPSLILILYSSVKMLLVYHDGNFYIIYFNEYSNLL